MDERSKHAQYLARQHWDLQVQKGATSWTSNAYIRDRIFQRLSGTTKFWLSWLLEDRVGRRFARALSIGCGAGGHELIMQRTGLIEHIDGFDLSPVSIGLAVAAAEKEGITDINFYVSSFEEFISAPQSMQYDLICFFG